jgi:hypothetical protein
MNHPGAPEAVAPEWRAPTSLRAFKIEVVNQGGEQDWRQVDAHRIVFGERFVQFWENRPPDEPDFMVLAVHVSEIVTVEELRWVAKTVTDPTPIAEADVPVVRRPLDVAADLLHLSDLDG